MKFSYSEFDGDQSFLSPDELFAPPQVMNFILQYGQEALDAMAEFDDPDQQQFVQQLIDAGLLEEYKDEQGNRKLRMTNRMIKGFQHRALLEVFENLKKGSRDGHTTRQAGRTNERSDGTRPYQFGDPLSEIDLGTTMKNVAARQAGLAQGIRPPFKMSMDDVELFNTEGSADCATVMLIDLSGSMMRYGRFLQAKRVAMGMAELIRARFPLDTIDYVTFYSLAKRVQERDLSLVMPKPVTIHDYRVRIRMPLEQAYAREEKIPLHFTNLQLGLREARRLLARKGAANKQIFVITDGQPTAHVEKSTASGTGEDMLYLLYPPDQRTSNATLQEAMRCRQQGIRIATFALIEDYFGMDWVGFVDQMTRLTKGLAYYCTSHDLSSTVIESYLTGKRRKTFVS